MCTSLSVTQWHYLKKDKFWNYKVFCCFKRDPMIDNSQNDSEFEDSFAADSSNEIKLEAPTQLASMSSLTSHTGITPSSSFTSAYHIQNDVGSFNLYDYQLIQQQTHHQQDYQSLQYLHHDTSGGNVLL